MTTTPAMPELPEPEAYIFQHEETGNTMFVDRQQVEWGFEKNNPRLQKVGKAYTADQMRAYALATLQSQPAEVSEEEIERVARSHGTGGWQTLPDMIRFARTALALRPQSESEQEKELRRSLAEAQATISERNAEIIELQKRIRRSPQAVPMTEGWQEVAACPDGAVWFSLSCGHVVMGWKQGPLLLDWEAAVDHDCCSDASAIKAMPVTPPAHHGITAPAGWEG